MSNETKKFGTIYAIVNLINGKRYIGQTIRNPKRRYGQHLSHAKWGSGQLVHQAIRIHGTQNFELHVLQENVPIDALTDTETFYITKYNSIGNGYNLYEGKATVNEDSINNLKKAAKKRVLTEETKRRMSQSTKGIVTRSEAFKKNLSEKRMGVPKTEAHKQAMREGWAKRRETIATLFPKINLILN